MNYTLPFYGLAGTISTITEDDKHYIVTRYGKDIREDKTKLLIRKSNASYKELMENYYDDLKTYLEIGSNRYSTYKKASSTISANSNMPIILRSLAIIMISLSVPLLLTHEALGYIGVVLDVLSIPTSGLAIKLTTLEKKEKQRKQFIKKYDNYQREFKMLTSNLEIQKTKDTTKYNGLEQNKNTPIRELNKTLSRKKIA